MMIATLLAALQLFTANASAAVDVDCYLRWCPIGGTVKVCYQCRNKPSCCDAKKPPNPPPTSLTNAVENLRCADDQFKLP